MNQVAQASKLGAQVALTSSEGGFAVTPQTLNDIVEFAKFMSLSNAGIPSYLRGNAPDCAAITMQALKWGFDPFSVAQKSYKVKDVLAYEAQLIAAVINARSGIKGRLKYQFDGEGDELVCTVVGTLDGEDCVYRSPRVGNITTKNSPLWKTDPQQQLGYYSARNWARRHCPEVILGAYDRDEAEEFRGPDNARDITPRPTVMERLRASANSAPETPAGEQEGFSASSVHQQTESVLTGDVIEPNSSSEAVAPLEDASDVDGERVAADSAPSEESAGDPSPPADSLIPEKELVLLRRFAKDVFLLASKSETSGEVMTKVINRWINIELLNVRSDAGRDAVKAIHQSVKAIMKDEVSYEAAVEFHAEGLGVSPDELMGVVDNG